MGSSLHLAALLGRLAILDVAAYPPGSDVAGQVREHVVRDGESLVEIAPAYDVGYNAIAAANPGLDPFVPGDGARVTVPTAWIVPAAPAGTVVVNLSEMRLYLVLPGRPRRLATFPIGVGTEGNATPLGSYRVIGKEVRPTWRVPASIRREEPSLPEVVPPGPDNPLGSHALRLTEQGILIHGTNRPYGVGRKVSHGCIRLYPDDINRLFDLVAVGAPVRVTREPVKVGTRAGRIYVEVHRDVDAGVDDLSEATRLLASGGLLARVDSAALLRAVEESRGIPVDVTAAAASP